MPIEKKIAELLIRKQKTLALAESCSGGLLADKLTNIPGSSKFLLFGVIAYSNEAKIKLLKVPKETIKKFGAVSKETAVAMAVGCRKILNADFGISITGIAGPGGATAEKPIGLTFIAVNDRIKTSCVKCLFKGTRISIKNQAANQALKMLEKFLS